MTYAIGTPPDPAVPTEHEKRTEARAIEAMLWLGACACGSLALGEGQAAAGYAMMSAALAPFLPLLRSRSRFVRMAAVCGVDGYLIEVEMMRWEAMVADQEVAP